jgi:hypothetical protein
MDGRRVEKITILVVRFMFQNGIEVIVTLFFDREDRPKTTKWPASGLRGQVLPSLVHPWHGEDLSSDIS